MISLRPIDDSNRDAVLALRVTPVQGQFVSSVADSLAEATEEPDGRAIYWAISDGDGRRPEVEVMRTSAGQGEGSPIPFYERYGFEQTGEIVFADEVLLWLQLRGSTPSPVTRLG